MGKYWFNQTFWVPLIIRQSFLLRHQETQGIIKQKGLFVSLSCFLLINPHFIYINNCHCKSTVLCVKLIYITINNTIPVWPGSRLTTRWWSTPWASVREARRSGTSCGRRRSSRTWPASPRSWWTRSRTRANPGCSGGIALKASRWPLSTY